MKKNLKIIFFIFKKKFKEFFPKFVSPVEKISLYESITYYEVKYYHLYNSENEPINNIAIKSLYNERINNNYTNVCNRIGYISVNNSEIHSLNGVLTIGDKILNEVYDSSSKESSKETYDNDLLRYIFRGRKILNYQKVLLVSTSGIWGYYHFLYDFVPKILLMRDYWDLYDVIIINKSRARYLREFLEIFGIDYKTISVPSRTIISSNNLDAPLYLSQIGNPNRYIIKLIRENFLSKIEINDNENYNFLFISRRNTLKRRIINEEKLFENLRPLGFRLIELEKLPISDQISIFTKASVIISPHGSGLSNIVFCNPMTSVIELFPSNYLEACFANVSNLMNIKYNYLIFDSDNKNNDFYVDIEILMSYLKTHEEILSNF